MTTARTSRWAAFLCMCMLAAAPAVKAPADTGTAGSFTVVTLPEYRMPYVSLIDLAEKYNVRLSYDPVELSMTAARGNDSLKVTNQCSTALMNGNAVNLMHPGALVQGAMFVPAATFLPLFSTMIPGEISWDEKKKSVMVTGTTYNIEKVSFEAREGGTLIKILLLEPLRFTGEMSGERWLHLTFTDGIINPSGTFAGKPAGLITETLSAQADGRARLSFMLSEPPESYSISKNHETDELLISLRKKRIPSAREAPVITLPDTNFTAPSINRDVWLIDTVVIDPGHGGKDSGAIGPGGTKEKDIVLRVAKELKKVIEERGGMKAVLTRDHDVFISLKRRAEIANAANGKLFISIHCNGHKNKRISGMEVYFLSEAKTENAQRVADMENEAVRYEDNPDYYTSLADIHKKIMFDMMSNVFLKESQEICKLVLDNASATARQENRRVRQAGFYVMLGTQATMPSILFELGYITNPSEEKMLKRVSYQKRIADAVCTSILEFKRFAEKDIISEGR